MARLFTGIAWLFALATIATLIQTEISDDPEYYVPVIAGLIAGTFVVLAWYLRRRGNSSAAGR